MNKNKLTVMMFCGVLGLCIPGTLWAQQEAVNYDALLRGDKPQTTTPESCPAPGAPKSGMPGQTTLIGLLFILGLGGSVAAFGWQKKRQQSETATGALRHIHSLQLGQNHQVSLIEVEGRPMVVGLTQGEIKILEAAKQTPAAATSAAAPAAAVATRPVADVAPLQPAQAFDALLQSARQEQEAKQAPPAAAPAAAPAPARVEAAPAQAEVESEAEYVLEEVPTHSAPAPENKVAAKERRQPVAERESINTQREAASVRRGIENLRNQHRKTP